MQTSLLGNGRSKKKGINTWASLERQNRENNDDWLFQINGCPEVNGLE